jgi:anti-sigma factor RsiW
MNCEDVRTQLLQYQRGQLDFGAADALRAHLDVCAACGHEAAAERTLTELLERRLLQHPASLALKRRLAAAWPAPTSIRGPWWRRWARTLVPAFAVVVALVVALPVFYYERTTVDEADGTSRMVAEAINDYLRVLSSQHPVEIQSGGIHQVKPWFEGRLDFAPVVSFAGDQDFPLEGGAVGYFLDRKAAIFVYRRRLHLISLFVFRAGGLPWPKKALEPLGRVRAYTQVDRGINTILWRDGDLGYALASDIDVSELHALALKLAGNT